MKLSKLMAIYFSLILSSSIFAALPTYTLNEYIGKDWDTHTVQYDLSDKDSVELEKGYILVNQLGNETPFQIDALENKISFIASMAPFSTNTYSFKKAKSTLDSKMYIKDSKGIMVLSQNEWVIDNPRL